MLLNWLEKYRNSEAVRNLISFLFAYTHKSFIPKPSCFWMGCSIGDDCLFGCDDIRHGSPYQGTYYHDTFLKQYYCMPKLIHSLFPGYNCFLFGRII
jgi:hypothetical protein